MVRIVKKVKDTMQVMERKGRKDLMIIKDIKERNTEIMGKKMLKDIMINLGRNTRGMMIVLNISVISIMEIRAKRGINTEQRDTTTKVIKQR